MASSIDLTNTTHSFEFYCVLIIGSIGILTNLMNIHVSFKKEFQETTMGFYNILLSITGILIIIFVCFLSAFPQSIGENELILTSDIACKLFPYFSRIFLMLNTWINVMVSTDRMILMSYNNIASYNRRSPLLKDRHKMILYVGGLALIICLLNFAGFLFHLETQTQIDLMTNKTLTSLHCTSTPMIVLIRDLIPMLFRVIIPLIIQIVISIILVIKLSKLKINVRTLSLKREYRFTFTIIFVNFIFIIADLFLLISTILINIYGYNQTYVSTTSNSSAVVSFVYICSVFGEILMRYDFLFFINLFTNSKFRKESKKIYLNFLN